jgi:hypothetical protein
MKQITCLLLFAINCFYMAAQTKIEGVYDPAREVFLTEDSTYWISYFTNDLARIHKNGYVGLIDQSGTILCAPKYDKIFLDDGKMIRVALNEKYGVIDRNGKELIKPKYRKLMTTPIQAFIVAEKELYGILDSSDQLIIPYKYDSIEYLFQDLFKVFDKSVESHVTYRPPGRWGVISLQGNQIVPIACDVILKVNEEHGIAQRYVTTLTTPSEKSPDTVGITVSIQQSFAYFNNKGTMSFDTPVQGSSYNAPVGRLYFSDGKIPASFFEYHAKKEFFDRKRTPEWLILNPNTPLQTTNGVILTAGVVVSDGKKFGYKDLTGKLILPYSYEAIDETDLGTLRVTLNGKTFLIDKKGNRIN